MKGPLISIVVPVYKVEEYLPACLASIRGQTFDNWECLLVDDGSPDGCGKLCDEAAAADSRFVVIHKANAGVSAARNAGLAAARGEYLLFCDADDALAPDEARLALDAAARWPGDLIVWRRVRSTGELEPAEPGRTAADFPQTCFSHPQSQVYLTTVNGHAVTNKLFSLPFLRRLDLRFDESISMAEDYLFVGACLEAFFARHPEAVVRQLEANLYYWRLNLDSVSYRPKAARRHGRVEWDPGQHHDYARRLAAEYEAARDAMGGWEAMPREDMAPQLRTYLRRFAFAVWAARQLGEPLPPDFFSRGPVPELLALLRRHRLFTPYYLLFRLRWPWLIARAYDSEESLRLTLYRRLYTLTYYTLALLYRGRWEQP